MSKLAEDLSQGGSNKKVQSKSMYFEQGEYTYRRDKWKKDWRVELLFFSSEQVIVKPEVIHVLVLGTLDILADNKTNH